MTELIGSQLQAAGGTAMQMVIAALPRAAPTCDNGCGIGPYHVTAYANPAEDAAGKWLANMLFSKV